VQAHASILGQKLDSGKKTNDPDVSGCGFLERGEREMKRLWRALALVGAGALVIGVAVALAGVPHLLTATGDVSAGTTCTTKRCTTTTTTLAKTSELTAAAAPTVGTQIIPAIVTVNWSGSQMSKSDLITARLQATAKWACFNGGSNIPADNNNSKSAQTLIVDESLTNNPTRNGNTSGSFTIDITPTAAELGVLACQGNQVIALYSLRLLEASDAFQVTASSDQGSSSVPVTSSTIPYCRDGNTAACFS
jgi:hypothetical protein